MSKKVGPTERTLGRLRKNGFIPAVVEKWNHHTRIRQDLFGFVDVVAIDPTGDTVGMICIQATSETNTMARVNKILEKPWPHPGKDKKMLAVNKKRKALVALLKSQNILEVWGWVKKDGRWKVRRVRIKLNHEDIPCVASDIKEW